MAENQGLKVAIVVCAWPPQGGGIGNNAYYQAIKLAERGYQVGVFTPDFLGIIPAGSGVKLFNLKTFLHLGKAGFMIGLWRQLKNYDIIQLDYPFFGSDLIVWWYKKRNPQTKLFIHYKMDPIGQGIKGWIFWLYLKMFLGLIIKTADRVGVLSYDHAENSYLAKYLKTMPNKFVAWPNGIDADIFKPLPPDQALRAQYRINVDDKIIVFVGGLDDQHYFKGVPILLEAFKQLPIATVGNGQVKLLIIGDGNLRPEFEQLAERLGVRDRIIFTGWIKNEELPNYYSLADIFVLPSTDKTECFGIVVAEAQACGLAAVVANWPGVRTTLIDGKTGFIVEPSNVADLAQKLKQLLSDEKLCQEFGSAGQINTTAKYDWRVVIDKIEKIYSNL